MNPDESVNSADGATPKMFLRLLGLGLLLVAAWLLWSGLFKPLLLALGIFSCALTLYIVGRMYYLSEGTFVFHFRFALLRFWAWLGREIVASSLEVARVVLRRELKVDPRVVALDATGLDRLDQAILGNSITLTPGTLTLDVHDGRLLVHALTPEAAEALEAGEMQRRVKALRSR